MQRGSNWVGCVYHQHGGGNQAVDHHCSRAQQLCTTPFSQQVSHNQPSILLSKLDVLGNISLLFCNIHCWYFPLENAAQGKALHLARTNASSQQTGALKDSPIAYIISYVLERHCTATGFGTRIWLKGTRREDLATRSFLVSLSRKHRPLAVCLLATFIMHTKQSLGNPGRATGAPLNIIHLLTT